MPTQNLVQIQNDLQSLPPGPQTMMYLKRAKDGMVASVPPYLAAAELASREKQAMRQKLSSGAAPGELPTVSQQLSQKADLLALQAMKKQEMDRQATDQARTAPMPAPEGAPAPEEQPQPEGGIAALPVEFGFEGGGLVAFQEGGPSSIYSKPDPLVQAMNRSQPSEQDIAGMDPYVDENGNPRPKSQREAILAAKARLRGTQQNVADYQRLLAQKQAATQSAAFPAEAVRRMEEFYPADAWAGRLAQPSTPAAPSAPGAPGAPGASGRGSAMTPQQIEAQVKQPPQRAPAAPGPQAAAPQQPAAPTPQQSVEEALMKRLGLAPGTPGLPAAAAAAPTMAGTAEDIKAAQAAFGLDKAAGEEERRLIADMQARQSQREKERARMGLKGVLAGFSQGYGGAAAADVAAANRAYAEDMAHQQEMYKLINAINTGNRKEAEKAVEKTIGMQQQREQDVSAMSRTELQALASMYGNMLQAGSSRYNTDAHVRVALAQARQAAERGERDDKKLAIDGLQSAERGIQQELTKLQGLMDRGSKERRAQLDKDLTQIRREIARIAGVQMPSRTDTSASTGKVVNWSDIK